MQEDWQRFVEQQLMNIQKQNETQSELLYTIKEHVRQMDKKQGQLCEIVQKQDDRISSLEQTVSKHSLIFKIMSGALTLVAGFIAAVLTLFKS